MAGKLIRIKDKPLSQALDCIQYLENYIQESFNGKEKVRVGKLVAKLRNILEKRLPL